MNQALIISGPEEVGRRLLYALTAPLLHAKKSSLFECISAYAIQKRFAVPDTDYMSEFCLITDPKAPGEFCLYNSFREVFNENEIINLSEHFPELKLIQISLSYNYQFSGKSFQNGRPVGDMNDFNKSNDGFYTQYLNEAESAASKDCEIIETEFDEAIEKIWREALKRARNRTLSHHPAIEDPFRSGSIDFPLVKDAWGFTCLDRFLWQASPTGREVRTGGYDLINTMNVNFEGFSISSAGGLFNLQQLRALMDRCEDDQFARSLALYGRIFNGLHVAVLASLEHEYGSSTSKGFKNLLKYCGDSIFIGNDDKWAFICSASPHVMSFLNKEGYPTGVILSALHFLDPSCQAAFMESYLEEFCPDSLPDDLLTLQSKQSYIAYLIRREVHQMESHHAKRKRARISV